MIGGRKGREEWCAYDDAFASEEGGPVLFQRISGFLLSNDGGKGDDLIVLLTLWDMTCYDEFQ